MNEDVSILVPNFRTPEITRICMRLLRKFTDPRKTRVIAIDNGSGDESLAYLRSLEWIELIERTPAADDTPPLSHARALDLALERVSTPYVLSIHTDTFVKDPGWLDVLLAPFRADPTVAGVGSWKLESKSRLELLGRNFEKTWKMGLLRLTGIRTFHPVRFDDDLRYLRSHCAMYRTDIIRQLGTGFADGDSTAGMIMHRKMLAAGYRMVFLESEELGRYVDHLNHATLVLNPDLGSKRKSVREGQKRLRHKLRGIDALAILADTSLDH